MTPSPAFAVAPMMDRTDRHCRYFHRQLTRSSLLFTEMVTADAVLHGDREMLLGFDPAEEPVALQLGGSDPGALSRAARIGADWGYDEINLNVGCPSDRVKSGHFGACLMLEPLRVADCVAEMRSAVDIRVTVKCRLGVDDQDPETALDILADAVVEAGVDAIWVHARKAWLKGLNPKQNRTVPPLDYDRVYRLKQRMPDMFIGINGGIEDLDACREHLRHVDGVMVGRTAFDQPSMLTQVDRVVFDATGDHSSEKAVGAMIAYAEDQTRLGVPIGRIVRPMLGLFHGLPGARAWRRSLTEGASHPGAGPAVIADAFASFVERGASDDASDGKSIAA